MKKSIALKALLLSITCGFITSTALAQSEEPFKVREVDTKPQIIYKEKAKYTEEARINNIEGSVVLSVILDKNETISIVRVVRGLPYGLSETAMEAAKKIKFKPAIKNEVSVTVRMQLEYNFNLVGGQPLEFLYFDYGETKDTLKRAQWIRGFEKCDLIVRDGRPFRRFIDTAVDVSVGLIDINDHYTLRLIINNKSNDKLLIDSQKIHFWVWEDDRFSDKPKIIKAINLNEKIYEMYKDNTLTKDIQLNFKNSFKRMIVSVKVNGTYYEFFLY